MNYFDFSKMTRTDIIEHMKKLSKSYTPEWNFDEDDQDFGSALALIFADMFINTIKKTQQMPEKHYIDFLNMLNPVQKSSKGANGYATFTLSEGTLNSVSVKLGQQLIGNSVESENLIFETNKDILLIPANIENIFLFHGEKDILFQAFDLKENVKLEPFFLMTEDETKNIQTHKLNLKHGDALKLESASYIDIYIENYQDEIEKAKTIETLSNSDISTWSYIENESWKSFDEVTSFERGIRLKNNKEIKMESPELLLSLSNVKKIVCDNLRIKSVAPKKSPDYMYNNEIELESSEILPFGENFYTYDSFYISSDEFFSKKSSQIKIDFDYIINSYEMAFEAPKPDIKWKNILKKSTLKEVPEKPIFISDFIFEYWNGVGWSKINIDGNYRKMFEPGQEGVINKEIIFICPNDFEKTTVGAYENYWIRVRILKVENAYVVKGKYFSPRIKKIALSYDYTDDGVIPESIVREEFLMKNNISTENKPMILFNDYGDLNFQGMYMQFDKPFIGGPIKMFFEMKTVFSNPPSKFKWQILKLVAGQSKWIDIDVIDGTNNFQKTGVVTFIGDENHFMTELFGVKGYWIRVIEIQKGKFPVYINSIYLNSVEITQKETIVSEYFTLRQHEYNKIIELKNKNLEILDLWVNEKNISIEEIKFENLEYEKKYSFDGELEELWVKWKNYNDVKEMGPTTRGYCANLFSGEIQFGDTINGFLPDGIIEKNIRVDYSINQGEIGNVDSFNINRLAQSISNVNTVFNPVSLRGGHRVEPKKNALSRTAEFIRHKNRARGIIDLDHIILAVDYDIREVKTLSNTDSEGNYKKGNTVSIILPKNLNYTEDYFRDLIDRIKFNLKPKLPCTMVPEINYDLVEPMYVTIDVSIRGKIDHIDNYLETYNKIEEIINSYLDIFKGNQDKKGWHIGQLPNKQYLLSTLQFIDSLLSVDLLIFNGIIKSGYNMVDIPLDSLKSKPNIVIKNGKHNINLV